MLISNNQLQESQLKALDNLMERCKQEDQGLPSFYRHILAQKRENESNILYFEKGELIGFLSAYFFYSNACEISLLVAPSHRRKGIAFQLIDAIIPLLESKQLDATIFSTPATLHDNWLPKQGFSYQHTEYHMNRLGYDPVLINSPSLMIRKAEFADTDVLCAIDEACFKDGQVSTPSRFISLFNDNHYSLFLAFHQNRVVGKAHIRWEEESALFSDIAILPLFQRQGLGGELLAFCINHALTMGKSKLALDVETSNRNALDLYLRNGFKIAYEHDFWYLTLPKLKTLIQRYNIVKGINN